MAQEKRTPLFEKHREHQGKMVEFNGWMLPLQYQGIIEEVKKTRRQAALFDVSHMGEIRVRGKDALPFLQRVLTNNMAALKDGRIMYSPICCPDGGTVDDILVYRYDREDYLLVVNAGNTRRDFDWLQENRKGDVTLENLSEQMAQLALQGPSSQAIVKAITGEPVDKLPYYHFIPRARVAAARCILSRTGYTGEDGFELYCSNDEAPALWDALMEAGRQYQLVPAGLGARDILRLEAALPLYGHELSRELSPLEAGLERFVAFQKDTAFIGRESLLKKKEEGLKKKLAGIEMLERGIPREGYPVVREDRELGWVSSGTYSPTLDKNVALAFLDPGETRVGNQVQVVIRRKEYRARVVKLPFYRRR